MKEFKISSVSEYVEHIDKLLNTGELWFRGVSNTSYLPIPKLIWKNAVPKEGSLEHNFLVSYKSYIDHNILNSWEIFSLMQHHGLPTRLLDWSESALVALFFALVDDPKSLAYRAVWVLNPFSLNLVTLGNAVLYCPAVMAKSEIDNNGININLELYLSPNLTRASIPPLPEPPIAILTTQHLKRVSSQKGCFTVHGTSTESIDTYLKKDFDFHMIKIDARTNKERERMLILLNKMGIDEEFIFQDLDSLCSKINRKFKV